MFSKLHHHLPKFAPKRVEYSTTGTIEVANMSKPIQIQNISKTGVQFLCNLQIPNQTNIRLKWDDLKFGKIDSQLVVVRSIPQPVKTNFMYCYGSKFTSERLDLKKKVSLIVETTEEFHRITMEKAVNTISPKLVHDAIMYGRSFLRNILSGVKSPDVIVSIASELKDYEKDSFNHSDEISGWIQKLATQYFHSRLLCSLIAGAARIHDISKITQDKLQSMDCIVRECEAYAETKKVPAMLKETMNRVKYARGELTEVFNKRVIFSVKSGRLPLS